MDDSRDYPGRAVDRGPVDEGRSVLAHADSQMHLIGLTHDDLERMIQENSLGETHRALREALVASRALHRLADEFDVARNAARDVLEQTIREHDKRLAVESEMEAPRLVSASSVREPRAETGPGPSRDY